ncbi:unnamed protein product [Acanthoscelides obtectus]|uniref:Uncharacterized protein n=1 Tax=Acanthoscelides obtectus TaxID=200917 RepID=A0A9P0LRR7_ACAOB|nr:unnamed protein product [Acanthoscelides obtectus]CAK1655855.1 hypothetical protein AOBTE_LOCUS19393 [Acanthoscelides obtectus]
MAKSPPNPTHNASMYLRATPKKILHLQRAPLSRRLHQNRYVLVNVGLGLAVHLGRGLK